MHYFTDKMSDFMRRKNRELDDIKKERDKERKEKLMSMREMQQWIRM